MAAKKRKASPPSRPAARTTPAAGTSRRKGAAPAPRRAAATDPAPAVAALVERPRKPLPAEAMGRAMRWAQVTARDLMRRDVITVAYNAPLSEVERILSDNKISGAPVTDEGGRIIGILSLKDLVDRYTEDPDSRPRRGKGYFHLSSEELEEEDMEAFEVPEESEDTAQDVMNSQIYSVSADAGLQEIAAEMARHRIHRVVVEERGRIVGILSTTEILEALSA